MNTNQTHPTVKVKVYTNNPTANQSSEQLFTLSQRKFDNKWNLWVKMTPVELGIVTQREFVAEGQPFWMNQPIDTVVNVYTNKPTTQDVMRFLNNNTRLTRR